MAEPDTFTPPRRLSEQVADGGLPTARDGSADAHPAGLARQTRAQAQIVPQERLQGPIPWVIAIMVGLMVIAAAGALALRNTGRAAASDLAGGITVQIVEARPEVRARLATRAAAILRDQPGVSEVELIPQGELDALVEPWLGAGGPEIDEGGEGIAPDRDSRAGLPVPALIDARLAGPADPQRLAGLRDVLRREIPAARIDAQSTWLTPVFGAIESLTWLALALILLLGLATGAAVLLAARTALGNNRATIEIVHLLGGTDAQIAGIFQRSTAIDAAGGSLAGFAAAWIVVVLLGRTFAEIQAGLVTGGALGWSDWLVLALIPLGAVALATLTARWTVMRALKGML